MPDYARAIIHFSKSDMAVAISNASTKKEKDYRYAVVGVMTLPALFREDPKHYYGIDNTLTPRISHANPDIFDEQEFFIHLDGITIGKSRDPLTALTLMYSCYYVFNLVYPKELQSSLEFIQRFLVKIGDGSKPSGKLITAITKIRKYAG
ncbi:uncharacterized protein [Clytia hemisphaerica]